MRPLTQNLRTRTKENFIICAKDAAGEMEDRLDAMLDLARALGREGRYSLEQEVEALADRLRSEIEDIRYGYRSEIESEEFKAAIWFPKTRRTWQ